MKQSLLFLFGLIAVFGSSQGEEIAPLTSNYSVTSNKLKSSLLKIDGTFDSTFIYIPDTLSLPFFDEFSKNNFQVYDANYTDIGVTSDKEYRLLDNVTLLPIVNELYYTAQATFRRVYDIATSTFIDDYFTPEVIKVGDLTAYPVVYSSTDLYPPFYIYDTIGASDVSDTVWIVGPEFYQDSATQFFAQLNNPNAFWLDDNVYHNYRYGFEPRSLGVVSFDGLNSEGYPYSIGSTITNYADILTSKPLDLGSLTADDSVYFSFLYQKQGFGDIPEDGDSLVLEFYAKDLDQWFRVWSVNGGAVESFQVGHVLISNAQYFKKGYQFRFKNYGAMSGALDHFHVDYVHLRTLSGYQDTLFKDFAFVYPIGSLLKDYTSVPWDHFKNNSIDKMNDKTSIVVHNGSSIAENSLDGEVAVSYNSIIEGSFSLIDQILTGNVVADYAPRTTHYSLHDLSGGYVYDITKPENQVAFDVLATASAQFPNLPQNDSTTGIQFFSNFYSYDDGSAEAAYGPTGNQARLAIKYTAYEADSLIGVKMHFVPSVNDVSNKLFLVSVWDDDNGVPGNVLYEDDAFFPRQPVYANGFNNFVTYYFMDTLKVSVGETFYVGWRQFDSDRLNIGLDRNIDNKEKTFYSVNNEISWPTSSFEGSVMIHPVFSTTLDAELSIPEFDSKEIVANIYPNPTSDIITIDVNGVDFKSANIYALDGRLMIHSTSQQVDMSILPNGVYFVQIEDIGQKTYKVIVNR